MSSSSVSIFKRPKSTASHSLDRQQKQRKHKQTQYYNMIDQKCPQIPNDDKAVLRSAITHFDQSLVSLLEKYRKCIDTKNLQIYLRKFIQKVKAQREQSSVHNQYAQKILKNSSFRSLPKNLSKCQSVAAGLGSKSRMASSSMKESKFSDLSMSKNIRISSSCAENSKVNDQTKNIRQKKTEQFQQTTVPNYAEKICGSSKLKQSHTKNRYTDILSSRKRQIVGKTSTFQQSYKKQSSEKKKLITSPICEIQVELNSFLDSNKTTNNFSVDSSPHPSPRFRRVSPPQQEISRNEKQLFKTQQAAPKHKMQHQLAQGTSQKSMKKKSLEEQFYETRVPEKTSSAYKHGTVAQNYLPKDESLKRQKNDNLNQSLNRNKSSTQAAASQLAIDMPLKLRNRPPQIQFSGEAVTQKQTLNSSLKKGLISKSPTCVIEESLIQNLESNTLKQIFSHRCQQSQELSAKPSANEKNRSFLTKQMPSLSEVHTIFQLKKLSPSHAQVVQNYEMSEERECKYSCNEKSSVREFKLSDSKVSERLKQSTHNALFLSPQSSLENLKTQTNLLHGAVVNQSFTRRQKSQQKRTHFADQIKQIACGDENKNSTENEENTALSQKVSIRKKLFATQLTSQEEDTFDFIGKPKPHRLEAPSLDYDFCHSQKRLSYRQPLHEKQVNFEPYSITKLTKQNSLKNSINTNSRRKESVSARLYEGHQNRRLSQLTSINSEYSDNGINECSEINSLSKLQHQNIVDRNLSSHRLSRKYHNLMSSSSRQEKKPRAKAAFWEQIEKTINEEEVDV